jgi:hypothetical protein
MNLADKTLAEAPEVNSKNLSAPGRADTRHLKPMLGEDFIKPDRVQENRAIFIVSYEV